MSLQSLLMQPQTFFIYMVASIKGALYIGMTRNIAIRVEQHKPGIVRGFSSKYRTNKLVWCEVAKSFESARMREAELKGWRRSKKVDLIEVGNHYWLDISSQIG